MATISPIEQYVAEKKALIAEVTDGIALIFEKLERDLLPIYMQYNPSHDSEVGMRVIAYTIASIPPADGSKATLDAKMRGMRTVFEHYTHQIELDEFKYCGKGCTSFTLRFNELGLQRALTDEMGICLEEPIVVTRHFKDGEQKVEVRVPMLVHLEKDDLETFVEIFNRTWVGALTWARVR